MFATPFSATNPSTRLAPSCPERNPITINKSHPKMIHKNHSPLQYSAINNHLQRASHVTQQMVSIALAPPYRSFYTSTAPDLYTTFYADSVPLPRYSPCPSDKKVLKASVSSLTGT